MRYLVRWFAVVAIVAAVSASAQPGAGAWSPTSVVRPNDSTQYEFTTVVNSARLTLNATATICLHAASGGEVNVVACTKSDCASGELVNLYPDTDGDGVYDVATLNGTSMRTCLEGVRYRWIFVEVASAPSSGTARVAVQGF